MVTLIVKAVGLYVVLVVLTRLVGLRTFSKLSSFDFPITVATGSLLATVVISSDVSLLRGMVALAAILGVQKIVGALRRYDWATGVVDNQPMLLVDHGEILEDNLRASDVTVDDLRAKLREASVLRLEDTKAVVLETTGDISVMHADDDEVDIDEWLLEDVRSVQVKADSSAEHQ